MSRRFSQVDVFGADNCTGNPVAVVLDSHELTDEELKRFSVWSNLSECTFVYPPNDPAADYRVRIFSLNTELPFAGHPTLGTARAWLAAGGVPKNPNNLVQESEIGLVEIQVDDQRLAFSAPDRLRSGPIDESLLQDLIEILGVNRKQIIDAEWLDNGPGWVGLLLDNATTVLNLKPDASRHPGRWDIGVIAPSDPKSDTAFELRAFFTEGNEPLREDPMTGSLNASAAQWLIASGRASAPYIASQGTAMGRNGRIYISQDEAGLWVGGEAKIVISGSIYL
jgi:PhzF family phenazine biosynthesis protein